MTDGLRNEITLWVFENSVFPDTSAVSNTGIVGMQANSIEGKYIATNRITVAANTRVITMQFDAANISGITTVIMPEINNTNSQNIIRWVCSGTVGIDKLPRSCQ